MDKLDRKQAVLRAHDEGYSLKEIGFAIGTSGDNLKKIIERGSTRSRFIPRLDAWLEKHGYLSNGDSIDYKEIGERIYDYRQFCNVAREDGANYIGISVPELQRIEEGQGLPEDVAHDRVLDFLNTLTAMRESLLRCNFRVHDDGDFDAGRRPILRAPTPLDLEALADHFIAQLNAGVDDFTMRELRAFFSSHSKLSNITDRLRSRYAPEHGDLKKFLGE